MKVVAAVLWVLLAATAAAQSPGHRLPPGPEAPIRDRDVDVQHVDLVLRFDMAEETIAGTMTARMVPLRPLTTLTLDAAGLEVASVRVDGNTAPFVTEPRVLKIDAPAPLAAGKVTKIEVAYKTKPRAGLYFQPATKGALPQAWNYGEGGLHYGWLPLYNGMDDRFTVDMKITVPVRYAVLANGVLKSNTVDPRVDTTRDGTWTWHWQQPEPIPNYLLALNVGELVPVKMPSAQVGKQLVSLTSWGPPGREDEVALAFRGTEKMVEYFSRIFRKPYPWQKYDQVALRNFQGAMETTTMVGFADSQLRKDGDLPDGTGPSFAEAYPAWTYEDVVAHELAHHWFGDFVTARSLSSLWLNESFATFAHTLWTGEAHGVEDMDYQRWRYLNRYLDYIHRTGLVRPMEYHQRNAPEEAYQEETTYLKGALVLHMLRFVAGDEAFFGALADYLDGNAFGFADSHELQESFARMGGRRLAAFFEDWIVGGGGHPVFEVSHRFSPERRQVDLTVKQVHADLPFENAFTLPVDVEIATAAGTRVHRVELKGWSTSVSLPADEQPTRVVFDSGGQLVAEVRHVRPIAEVLDQLRGARFPDRLRAARQLARDFPRREEATQALASILADAKAHWGLRQEAALDLGTACGEGAPAVLITGLADRDRRVRRAAALAAATCGGADVEAALRRLLDSESADDVAAVAARTVGVRRGADARSVLMEAFGRPSQWYDARRLGAILGMAELEDPSLAPLFTSQTDAGYVPAVRLAALEAWVRAAPHDPALPDRLRELTADRHRGLRAAALQKLGALHRAVDLAFLRAYAEAEPDPTLAFHAREAAEAIEAFVKH